MSEMQKENKLQIRAKLLSAIANLLNSQNKEQVNQQVEELSQIQDKSAVLEILKKEFLKDNTESKDFIISFLLRTLLAQDVLENVVVSDNTVSGTISLDTPKLLATQIPYSEGWRVFVDGEEAELVDVNTMFCGVMLDAGEHTVEFRYATPHWQLAVAMSVAGLVMLLVIALVWRKKHPKAAPAGIAAQPVAESASEESAVSDAAATATQDDAVAPDEIADTSATPDKTAGEALPPDEA